MTNIIGFKKDHQKNNRTWSEKNKEIDSSLHLAISGKTGSGKTRRALSLLNSRLSNGGVAVFDPKNVLIRDVLSTVEDPDKIYTLGVDSGGDRSLKINLFSYVTQSQTKIEEFSKTLLTKNASGDHRFWAESSHMIFSTSLSLYGALSRCLLHVSKIAGYSIDFKTTITYGKKEIDFTIPSEPMTFKEFWKSISDRNTFRQVVGNIDAIIENYVSKIKACVDAKTLSREDALMLDTYLHDISHFSKIFSTYRLPEKEDFSGTSGSYFGMIMGIPKAIYSDPTLNHIEDSHDIKQLLENKNCIIISTSNIEVQAFLFNALSSYFSARSSQPNCTEVTLLLDEANSLIKAGVNIDLEHIATFARSSKLSLVALFQSKGQIYHAFGLHTAEAILENMSAITMIDRRDRDPKYFYYKVDKDQDIIGFDPLFKTDKEKYVALKEYQQRNGDFRSVEKNEDEVVIFDHDLYDVAREIILVDVNTLESRNVKYTVNENQFYGYFMDQLEANILKEYFFG